VHSRLIELKKKFQPAPLTQLFSPLLERQQIELWVKRDDLIHPIISGNKWRKLKYILDHALTLGDHTIISMGGAYSNHLHALAFIGKLLNIQTIGYIRGERPQKFSPTLIDMQKWGMELRFVSRSEYRDLRGYKQHTQLPNIKKGQYWLPEGGATKRALKGVGEIITEIVQQVDIFCVPCGTGTTLAGLIQSASPDCMIQGFSALKGAGYLTGEVEKLIDKPYVSTAKWNIQMGYHFGGFAKTTHELLLYIEAFEKEHSIKLETVYTGKMFYAVFDLIQRGAFKSGQKIVAIHTGGLQGNR
jgi:1-aminocyclopropane-1-carboxylate deaminase